MDRPNILLITTDQQRFDTIHAAGCDAIHTPNLDRLVHEGCFFTNAYSPNPVCIPARHNILTGLGARHHGLDDNYFVNPPPVPYQLPTFPQIVTDDGAYDAIGIGKMHFLPCRRHNGFNHLRLMEEIPVHAEEDDYTMYLKSKGYGHLRSVHGVRHLLYMQPQQSMVPMEHHGSHWVADETISYIEKTAGKRPFLVWSSFISPHPPLDVPSAYADLYAEKDLPVPTVSNTPLSPLAQENKNIANYPDPSYLKRTRELYYSAITFVDYNIGRILQTLEKKGILDNTVIIFTSDHGEMLGDLGTYQKFLPYDGASKIPMIIRYPKKFAAGSKQDSFVDLNDILPTILDAAQVSYPGSLDLPGESLLTPIGKKDRSLQYIEHCKGNRRWISLRNQRYKFNYYYAQGQQELFDMEADPHETTNLLYQEPSQDLLAIRDDLYKKLVEYERRYGLEGYVEGDKLKVLEPFKIQYYEEMNFPKHLDKLSPEELQQLRSIQEEILVALTHEPVVDLTALDTTLFQEFSGLTQSEIQQMYQQFHAMRTAN